MTPAQMAALHADCFSTPRPWSSDEIVALLDMPDVFCHHAPAAFLLGRVAADEAEILTLAVAPTARRQGTGRALVTKFEAEAKSRGAKTAFLEVAAANMPARALYAALGYTQTGRRPGYYQDPANGPDDALILAKLLMQTDPASVE